jgi:DNA repair photolyase
MKINTCSPRTILQPCELSGYKYQIDPYIGCEHHCNYCYAHNKVETDWTEEILVHKDFKTQLTQELLDLNPQPIYFGWNSDPYQPSEETLQHTRKALELLAEGGFSVCILTKSNLVTRDIDLLTRMPDSSVGFSIAFHDDDVRTLFEANAPTNHQKITGLKALIEAGIETYVLITPIMPLITDVEACIKMVVPYADTLWFYPLNMDSEGDRNWQNLRMILDNHYPNLTEVYRQVTFSSGHPYWKELREKLEDFRSSSYLDMRIHL